MFSLEFLLAECDNGLIKVSPTEERVTTRRDHLHRPVSDGEDGHIEGAATVVEHEDVHVVEISVTAITLDAVSNGGGRRLTDHAEAVKSGDGARVLRGLLLCLAEVCGHSDDSFFDLLTSRVLSDFLHLLQHDGGELLSVSLILLFLFALHTDSLLLVLRDLERPVRQVLLHLFMVRLFSNKSFDVVDERSIQGFSCFVGGTTHLCLVLVLEHDDRRYSLFAHFL